MINWQSIGKKITGGVTEAISNDEKIDFWSKLIGIGAGALLLIFPFLSGSKDKDDPHTIVINNYLYREDDKR